MALPTLAEAKIYLRVDHSDEDSLITGLLAGAVGQFESTARRILTSRTLTQKHDSLEKVIPLQQGPVVSVTSVTVRTMSGTSTISASDYIANTGQEETNPLVCFKDGATLPTPDGYPGSVTVTYVAGTTTIPDEVNAAILQLLASWYENRAAVGPTGGGEVPMAFRMIALSNIWGAYS